MVHSVDPGEKDRVPLLGRHLKSQTFMIDGSWVSSGPVSSFTMEETEIRKG